MLILNVACLCATPYITSFEYQCVVGQKVAMSLPVDEWDWVAGGVQFGPMTPLWCY